MKKLYFVIFLSFCFFGFSQSLDMKWIKSFTSPGEELNPVFSAPLPNEGVVLTGWQQRPWNSWTCLFVLAIDSSGNELWRDSIEIINSTGELYLRGITVTPQGEVIVVGMFTGSLRCSGTLLTDSTYGYNSYIAKFSNGALSSLSSVNDAWIERVTADSQGNIFYAMEVNDSAHGFGTNWTTMGLRDLIVCKVSPTNTLLWSKQFTGNITVTHLAATPQGEAVIFGAFSDSLCFDFLHYPPLHNGPWGSDLFKIKMGSAGNVTKAKVSTAGFLDPTQLVFNNDKIIITAPVCGNHECGVGYQQIDSTLTPVWYKGFPQYLGYGDNFAMYHIASIDAAGFWAFGKISTGTSGSIGTHRYVFTYFSYNGNVISSDTFFIPAASLYFGNGGSLVTSSGASMYASGMFKDSLTLYGKQVTGTGNQMFISRLRTTNIPLFVDQHVYHDIQIYPNPTNGLFILTVKNSGQAIRVYSPLGALVCDKQLTIGNNDIDLSDEAKGIYCIEISGDKERFVKKVVVE